MRPSGRTAPLLAPLVAVQRLLAHYGNRGLVIGGVAASLLGQPRFTADVDVLLLLSTEELPPLIEAAAGEGLQPRIADAGEFARQNRVLLLRHAESGVGVDVSLGLLPFEEEAVERGTIHHVGPVAIRLPTPEDLIILKAIAHRPQDLEDIRMVIESHPNLDRERVRYWVREFARVLEMPELWDDIAPWLQEPS